MKIGKISESVLKRSVLKQIHKRQEQVVAGARVGADFAAVAFQEDELCILSTDPVTQAAELGKKTVYTALNNVACAGAEAVGILVSVLLSPETTEPELRQIMKEMEEACAACGAEVMGGHTEVTDLVRQPLVTVTGVGRIHKQKLIRSSQAEAGMDILVTGFCGLEGTAELAVLKEAELKTRFSERFLAGARDMQQQLSVIPAAAIATESGAAAMHNVARGGIFAALWEMAEASGIGLEIDLKKLPFRQETVEISEFFGLNPYELAGSGAMIIAATDGNSLILELQKAGIPAVIVGKATDSNDRILWNGEEKRFLEPAGPDEIHKIFTWEDSDRIDSSETDSNNTD